MKILPFFAALVSLAIWGSPGHTQGLGPSDTVHDLYFSSVAYPEQFDDSMAVDLAKLNYDEVMSCLVTVRDLRFALAKATLEQCKQIADPAARWQCLKDDPNASTAYWAAGVIAVLKEESMWTATFSGDNMNNAKRLMEMLEPGMWVAAVKAAMPMIEKTLVCP